MTTTNIWEKEEQTTRKQHYEMDVTKLLQEVPKDIFESIRNTSKLEIVVMDAWHIMWSAIEFHDQPEFWECTEKRMREFLEKYAK